MSDNTGTPEQSGSIPKFKLDFVELVDDTLDLVQTTSRDFVEGLSNLTVFGSGSAEPTPPSTGRNHIKSVLLGDSVTRAERVSFAHVYTQGPSSAREEKRTSATEMLSTKAIVDGSVVSLDIWVASEDSTLRHLLYIATDVCILTYDPTKPATITNIMDVWVPELLEHLATSVWIFVPLAMEDRDTHIKTTDIIEKIGGIKVIKSGDSVDSVKAIFEAGARLAMQLPDSGLNRCEAMRCRQKLLRAKLKKCDDESFKSSRTERLVESLKRVDAEVLKELESSETPGSFSRRISTLFSPSK